MVDKPVFLIYKIKKPISIKIDEKKWVAPIIYIKGLPTECLKFQCLVSFL